MVSWDARARECLLALGPLGFFRTAADEALKQLPIVKCAPSCRSTALRRCWMILLIWSFVIPHPRRVEQRPASAHVLPAHGDLMHIFRNPTGQSKSGSHLAQTVNYKSYKRRTQAAI
jgi:hypothetical protein